MGHNRSGSSFLVGQAKQRRASRSKPRLPIFQRFSFSVGHVLNDAVVAAWVSYMLIFQTKVLGMSNSTAGVLWIVPSAVDSLLCIVVGYICDNFRFPLLAKYYGKRKIFHLLGTILVAGFFPFLMMPCFVCKEDSPEWIMGIYYATIMILHNIGWAFSQVTHLALIPEIAKRPSEMVELHAVRSGFTFLSGIFMYAITWIVLRTDSGGESISSSQWKDFMEMAVIVVGTGCFFSLIFHLGTKEPPQAEVEKNKGPSGSFIGRERVGSRTSTLPLPDKAVGVFCLYDESELCVTPEKQTETMEVIQEEKGDTVLQNGAVQDRSSDAKGKKDSKSHSKGDSEKGHGCNEFSFSNPAFQTDGRLDVESEENVNEDSGSQTGEKHKEQNMKSDEFSFSNPAFQTDGRLDVESEESFTEDSGTQTGEKHKEQNMKSDEFSFSNPAFQTNGKLDVESKETVTGDLKDDSDTKSREKHAEHIMKGNEFSFSNPSLASEDRQDTDCNISRERSQTGGDSQNEKLLEERQSNRSDSGRSSEGYVSSPETDSVNSIECVYSEGKSQKEKSAEHRHQEICASDYTTDYTSPQARPRSLSSRRNGAFTKGSDTSYSGVSIIIEEVNEHETKSGKTSKTWTDWFKTPMFYKISFAYMCARLVQVLNSSYVPLYLTDTLGFEKESIAYFPLVILISGVFSSLCAKKLDKMLGEKWTYCLAASAVIGSSAWFYLQGESGRNAAYCAAILVGCGGSMMYVTSLALAGKLIGDNKESGAFVFASMSVFAKVACGTSILLTQQLFPTSGATGEYVRHVFSVGPGAGALLGFLAVIAFLPATVRCRKVVHTVDCSVQTEEMAEVLYAYDNPVALDEDFKRSELVIDINDKARVVS